VTSRCLFSATATPVPIHQPVDRPREPRSSSSTRCSCPHGTHCSKSRWHTSYCV
jgi:hypothetical protein